MPDPSVLSINQSEQELVSQVINIQSLWSVPVQIGLHPGINCQNDQEQGLHVHTLNLHPVGLLFLCFVLNNSGVQ